jgi:hypothetical protein
MVATQQREIVDGNGKASFLKKLANGNVDGSYVRRIGPAENQVLPVRGPRCKTSLMFEAFEPPTSNTTTTLFPGPREVMSTQASSIEQLKQQQ